MIPGTPNKNMESSVFGTMELQIRKPHTHKALLQSAPAVAAVLKSWGNAGAGDSRPGHNASVHWMSGFIWPTACQQTDPCFPKGLPNFAIQTENDHLWTWMTGLSNLFPHHINPEAAQLQGVLCQDALHHPARNFSIIVKTQRSNSTGLRNK